MTADQLVTSVSLSQVLDMQGVLGHLVVAQDQCARKYVEACHRRCYHGNENHYCILTWTMGESPRE